MREDLFKGGMAALGTILSYMAGNFTPLMVLLVLFEGMDYVTGMYAACSEGGGLSSAVAIGGFFKKVFYFFMVAVGFGMDFMIHTATELLGMSFSYPAVFGIFSVCYLLSTELISITENLAKIGIRIPLMTSALLLFREQLERLDGLRESEPEEKKETRERDENEYY